jgi:single-stranded-DNA-specific exonuclease
MELRREDVAAFAGALDTHARAILSGGQAMIVEHVDAVVGAEELSMELAEELRGLAPFGRGNPPVCLMLADASLHDPRPMGEGRHLRFTVASRGARARAVSFGQGGRLPVEEGELVDATFALEVNEWNGVSEPRLVLRRAQAIVAAATPESAPGAGEELGELALF